MGEDRTVCVEKKQDQQPCRHRHSSVISSCSEDAESESTSAGYPPTPDEEREEELEYGPGIVNKLRTRFLSISLKQNRGTNMRRSCSMENLLDQPDRPPLHQEKAQETTLAKPWGNLKRAKSMDTLLMELPSDDGKAPKVVKSGLNRLMPTICDEELPKPDTVKTYKRMFEPAEARRGSHCRRPPVLRASARSSSASKLNGVSQNPSAKVNGTSISRNKFSAKQSSPVKAQSPDLPSVNGNGKRSPIVEPSKPLFNGCHVVKATPMKINNIRNGREIENLNSINRIFNKKEVHFAPKMDIICNGNANHKDILKIKLNEDVVKQFTKNNMTNGIVKPKVPPNRPSLRSPKPLMKINEQSSPNILSPTKLKPILSNGLKKVCENNKNDLPKSPEPKSKDAPKISQEFPLKKHIKSPPPENKPKEDFVWPPEPKLKSPVKNMQTNGNADDAHVKQESDIILEPIPTPEKKIKDIIQTLSESSVKNESSPQEKVPTSKLPERTATVSPDPIPDKLLKSPTVPPPKTPSPEPVNTTPEPPIKPTNGLADPHTKPVNESSDKLTPTSQPEKKLSNGTYESPKTSRSPVNVLPTESTKKPTANGYVEPVVKVAKQQPHDNPDTKRPVKKSPPQNTSMVFDFRGKDVVSHVALLPTPFGCKALHPKKRSEDQEEDEEDEDYVDYSVPPPSGVVFEGENVKIGRGSILATRNKDLKITFDDDVDGNTFVYPSENSLLEENEKSSPMSPTEVVPNGQPPPSSILKTNTAIGSASGSAAGGGLSSYTPSVLRSTMDAFEPGLTSIVRPSPSPDAIQQDQVRTEDQDLKPADPDLTASWSISAGTSDLLF